MFLIKITQNFLIPFAPPLFNNAGEALLVHQCDLKSIQHWLRGEKGDIFWRHLKILLFLSTVVALKQFYKYHIFKPGIAINHGSVILRYHILQADCHYIYWCDSLPPITRQESNKKSSEYFLIGRLRQLVCLEFWLWQHYKISKSLIYLCWEIDLNARYYVFLFLCANKDLRL